LPRSESADWPEQGAGYARLMQDCSAGCIDAASHFGEDGKAADSAFRFSKSFSGKACPKLTT
jgi:hypothetical protein